MRCRATLPGRSRCNSEWKANNYRPIRGLAASHVKSRSNVSTSSETRHSPARHVPLCAVWRWTHRARLHGPGGLDAVPEIADCEHDSLDGAGSTDSDAHRMRVFLVESVRTSAADDDTPGGFVDDRIYGEINDPDEDQNPGQNPKNRG